MVQERTGFQDPLLAHLALSSSKLHHYPHAQCFLSWLVAPGHEWHRDGVPCLPAYLRGSATFDSPVACVALPTRALTELWGWGSLRKRPQLAQNSGKIRRACSSQLRRSDRLGM